MTRNIFQILGVQSKEDVISNALVYGLNNSCSFQDIFLENICKKDPRKYDNCKAYTRLSTARSGIPDIILSCHHQNDVDLIIVENKLKAYEGKDQTVKYASKESIDSLVNKLGLNGCGVNPSFVFLTLFPDQLPKSNQFHVSTYLELSNGLRRLSRGDNPVAEQLIDDWNDLVKQFYQCGTINQDDIITEKLSMSDDLDGGYLYFRSMLSELTFPVGLEVEYFFRSSRQGRHFYGAVISKDSWHQKEMSKINGKWQLNGDADFNIHFEPQYNVLNGMFNLFLHYEVNPYETEKWVLNNIDSKQYDYYKMIREGFAHKLKAQNIKGLIFGGGSNQIAKASFNFQNKKNLEVQEMIVDFIAKVTDGIDSILLHNRKCT